MLELNIAITHSYATRTKHTYIHAHTRTHTRTHTHTHAHTHTQNTHRLWHSVGGTYVPMDVTFVLCLRLLELTSTALVRAAQS